MTAPILLFAHGAGAGQAHPWMQRWASLLSRVGHVVPFEYPYMMRGRRAPDRLPVLLDRHRAVFDEVRAEGSGPIFLVGKSMGSRVGCHLSLERSVRGVVCFGAARRRRKAGGPRRRAQELGRPPCSSRATGTHGPLDTFASVRAQMRAPSALVVPGGNHSLRVASGRWPAGASNKDVDKPSSPPWPPSSSNGVRGAPWSGAPTARRARFAWGLSRGSSRATCSHGGSRAVDMHGRHHRGPTGSTPLRRLRDEVGWFSESIHTLEVAGLDAPLEILQLTDDHPGRRRRLGLVRPSGALPRICSSSPATSSPEATRRARWPASWGASRRRAWAGTR